MMGAYKARSGAALYGLSRNHLLETLSEREGDR